MFSRYGISTLVQLHEAQVAALRRETHMKAAAMPTASEEVWMFVRLAAIFAVLTAVVIGLSLAVH